MNKIFSCKIYYYYSFVEIRNNYPEAIYHFHMLPNKRSIYEKEPEIPRWRFSMRVSVKMV